MSCKRNRDVETKDSISYQQLDNDENNENEKLTLKENVNTENVLESRKENVNTVNNKKTQNKTNCCKMCRSDKSVEVESMNEVSDVGEENTSKVAGGNKKAVHPKDPPPAIIQVEDRGTSNDQRKAAVIQMGGNNANKPPSRRKSRPEDTVKYQNELYGKTKAAESKENTPERKKQKKKSLDTEQDIHAVYKSQIASLNTAAQGASSMEITTLDSQPTVEEESDLLENAEEERKRNKQRVRAKKRQENRHLSPAKVMTKLDIAYENAQREIDKVLQPQDDDTSVERKNRDKVKKKKKKKTDLAELKGEDNEACSSDEKESLETARQRMHKLLDDAFSVIAQRKSTIVNKVEPSRQSSFEVSSPTAKDRHLARTEQVVQTDVSMNSEKQHTPLHIYSQGLHEKAGLIPWSPYRAYDDTTLISLSNTETNLNLTPVQQEKFTTSVFEQQYSPDSKEVYATGPGEPIVIKTKNLEQNTPPSGSHRTTRKHSRQNDRHERPPLTNQVIIQNYAYDNTLPSQSTTEYPFSTLSASEHPDSYYELSSFQEIPKITPIPRLTGNNKNGNGSSRLKTQTHDIHTYPEEEGHTPRLKEGSKNHDIVDVIKESLQPGRSPQPLINSLRNELETLSSRKTAARNQLENPATNSDGENIRNKELKRVFVRRDEAFGGGSLGMTSSSDV